MGQRYTRRELRMGPPSDADGHWVELIGSTELYILHLPTDKMKGYEGLKSFLESQGCEVVYTTDHPAPVGPDFLAIRITSHGGELSHPVLKRAHGWAHRRNLNHLFFKESKAARSWA